MDEELMDLAAQRMMNPVLGGDPSLAAPQNALAAEVSLNPVLGGNKPWTDPKIDPKESSQQFLQASKAANRPWSEVAPAFKAHFGADPGDGKGYEQERRFAEEKAKVAEDGEGPVLYTLRRMVPFVSAGIRWGENKQYREARGRFEKGDATDSDLKFMALVERFQDIDRGRNTAESVLSGVASVPALVGEGAAGKAVGLLGRAPAATMMGAAGRRLGATAAMPSLYAAQAEEKLLRHPEMSGPMAYGSSLAYGVAQTAVLNNLVNRLGGSENLLKRIGGGTVAGMAQQQAVDTGVTAADKVAKSILGNTVGLDTGYGLVGDILNKPDHEALKHGITQAATFAVFSAMHAPRPRLGEKPPDTGEPVHQWLKDFQAAVADGKTEKEASNIANDNMLKADKVAAKEYKEQVEVFKAEKKAELDAQKAELLEQLKPEQGPVLGKQYGLETPPKPPEAPVAEQITKPEEAPRVEVRPVEGERPVPAETTVAPEGERGRAAAEPVVDVEEVSRFEAGETRPTGRPEAEAAWDGRKAVIQNAFNGYAAKQQAKMWADPELRRQLEAAGVIYDPTPQGRKAMKAAGRIAGEREPEPLSPEEEQTIARSSLTDEQKAAVTDYMMGAESYEHVGERYGVRGQSILNWGRKAFGDTAWTKLKADREARAMAEVERLGQRRPDRNYERPGVRQKELDEQKGEGLYSGIPIPAALRKALDRFTTWAFASGKAQSVPGRKIDTENIFPRLGDAEEFKAAFADPQGAGRVPGLARLPFEDARGTRRTPHELAITSRAAAQAMGNSIAARWAQMHTHLDAFFKDMQDPADVIEAEMKKHGSQDLTPEQRHFVHDVWTPALRDLEAMKIEEGVRQVMDEDGNILSAGEGPMFPRPAMGKEGLAPPARGTYLPFKGREHKTEREGREEGVIYDPSISSRVAKMISATYRAIANHRLANDPALRAEPASEYSWLHNEPVEVHPSFGGKVYPREVAEALRRAFQKPEQTMLNKASDTAKGLMLGLDFSFPFVQGLGLMFRHPAKWAKSTYHGIRAAFDSTHMQKVMNTPRYKELSNRAVQIGGTVGRLTDFMSALEKGQFATKLPILGRVYEGSGRGFGAFMDIAKLEMLDAWWHVTPENQRVALMERIENLMGHAKMEATGLSPKAAARERLLLLAPAYYRSAVNVIAGAFQGGVSGKMTRQMLGAFMGGITLSAVAAMKWQAGLSGEEIEKRLDPTKGKFLKVPVQLGDGKTIEVGFGNILTSVARLAGESAEFLNSDNPIDTGTDGNPMLGWLRGKAAFAPRLAVDMATGKDYFGNRVGVAESTIRAFEPLVVQQLLHGEGAVFEKGITQSQLPSRQNLADAIVSVMGAQAHPGSPLEAQNKYMDAKAQERFGKGYDALSLREKAQVMRIMERDRDAPRKPPPSPQSIERGMALQSERAARMLESLSPESKARLAELRVKPPGYEASIHLGGVAVRLSSDEIRRYGNLIAEEYDRTIQKMPMERLRGANPKALGDYVQRVMSAAKERARARLLRGDQPGERPKQSQGAMMLGRLVSQ